MRDKNVPSAPLDIDAVLYGHRLFERLRRLDVGARRCAPCDNSWVAVDRVVTGDGRMAILCHRAHACIASRVLAQDLSARELAPLGMHVLAMPADPDGHVNVVLTGCPGVRLRALAEACSRSGRSLSRETVWYLVTRTAELPSFVGDEIFDVLIMDESPDTLAQLVCGTLPLPVMQLEREIALRLAGIHMHQKARPNVPQVVQELLDGPRTYVDASAQLVDLARSLFPVTYQRHQQILAELGTTLEDEGRRREEHILQSRRPV